MVDILHKIGIRSAAPAEVYDALTSIEGLSGWWTSGTFGAGGVGEVLKFRFGDGGFDMKVLALEAPRRVRWEVVGGPAEWMGTRVSFELRSEGGWTVVYFKHEGWAEPVDFMHHCSTKWALFLLSLKQRLEGGAGAAWPADIKIDSREAGQAAVVAAA